MESRLKSLAVYIRGATGRDWMLERRGAEVTEGLQTSVSPGTTWARSELRERRRACYETRVV